jgi:hypothetical protein
LEGGRYDTLIVSVPAPAVKGEGSAIACWVGFSEVGLAQMFQLFSRSGLRNFIAARLGDDGFRARSAERDAETTRLRIESIVTAIDAALNAAQTEQAGLSRRVDDVLARAAVTQGNGTEEYLERDALDNYHQGLLGAEILNGQRRLKELDTEIANLSFVKAEMRSRFPDRTTSGGCAPGAIATNGATPRS